MNSDIVMKRRVKPLCIINENDILVAKKCTLFILNLKKNSMYKLADINISLLRKILLQFRLTTRLFGLLPRLAVPVNENEILISHHKSIYLLNIYDKTIEKVHTYEPAKGSSLSFCKAEEGIYYGQYYFNPLKKEVDILKYCKTDKSFTKVYSFKEGMINHIHRIVEDKYRRRIWIFTGDYDGAAAIYYTDDGFRTVSQLLGGAQKYRTCYAIPTEQGLIYATDTPLEQNYIRKLSIRGDKVVEEDIFEIAGSCIHGFLFQDWLIWSTTVENEPKEKAKFLKNISYRRGKGINSWYSEIIGYNVKTSETKVFCRFKKDILPMLLFGFGKVNFPYSEKPFDHLLGYGESLKRVDGKMILLKKV